MGKHTTNTKWRIAAIAIACILAHYADESDASAKNQAMPASCEAPAAMASAGTGQAQACILIRNSV